MDQQFSVQQDLHSGTVVVVDDDEATRESLRDLLESAGLEAVVFASGGSVLSSAPSLPRGCVLLDIGLPDYSGLAVYERLSRSGFHMPVIFMTGRADLAEQARSVSSAFAVLEKPLDDRLLLETIAHALASAPVADE